jgi:hypothetical protein
MPSGMPKQPLFGRPPVAACGSIFSSNIVACLVEGFCAEKRSRHALVDGLMAVTVVTVTHTCACGVQTCWLQTRVHYMHGSYPTRSVHWWRAAVGNLH